SFKYIDTSGNEQDYTTYQVDSMSMPSRIVPSPGYTWKQTQLQALNAVSITFKAGYGIIDPDEPSQFDVLPERARQLILFLVQHWYEQRAAVSETQTYEVPLTAQLL